MFDWNQGDHDEAEHVGIVERVGSDSSGRKRVYTIEGNSANGVNRRDDAIDDVRIAGYGRTAHGGSVAANRR